MISLKIPNRFYAKDSWLFRCRAWEQNGKIYQTVFRVRWWKQKLPDGGALCGGYRKRHLQNRSTANLELFLIESRRAELTHVLAILPFGFFGLFAEWTVIPIMLTYALVMNMPCIIAQRYNRPRIMAILNQRNRYQKI